MLRCIINSLRKYMAHLRVIVSTGTVEARVTTPRPWRLRIPLRRLPIYNAGCVMRAADDPDPGATINHNPFNSFKVEIRDLSFHLSLHLLLCDLPPRRDLPLRRPREDRTVHMRCTRRHARCVPAAFINARQIGARQRRAKRRCKVYKCDELCDTGAIRVLPFVR